MTFVTQQRSNASQGLTKQLNDLEVVLYHELDVPDHKSRCICIIEHYVSKHEVNKGVAAEDAVVDIVEDAVAWRSRATTATSRSTQALNTVTPRFDPSCDEESVSDI